MTRLRRDLLSMAAVTLQRTYDAVEALLTIDVETAKRIRETDIEIDAMEVEIDEQCHLFFAQHAPVAGDLRFVMVVMRTSSLFERIGDMAKTISSRVIDLHARPRIVVPEALEEMAGAATAMMRNAERALAGQDEQLARQILRSDDFVDERYRALVMWFIEQLDEGVDAQAIVDLLSIARSIERLADHSTSIAEAVLFLVGGRIVRHEQELES